MERFNLLPSVNWNISHMLVVSEDGTTCAYGSRGDIVIVKNIQKDDLKEYETKFIPKAHKNHRVMGLSFVKVELENEIVESLVSCGDDGRIKVWSIETGTTTHKCLYKKNVNTGMKLVDIDVFPQNNCIVTASEVGTVLKWHVDANKAWIYNVDPKIIINCIAVCPHVDDLIAIGAQFGLVLIYSLKGEGKLRHRIRCHDNAVFSVSWCPVPYNALQLSKLREDANFDEAEWKKKDKTLLLASCSKDRSIYICKAGTNGYCEAVLSLPSKPVTNASRQGIIPNIDRGRYLKWIYPSVLLTFSDFNEMIAVYLFSKNEQKSDPRQKIKLSSVKFEVKPIHNVHKRNISNFAVHLNNPEEVDFRVWSCSSDRLLVRGGYRVNYKEKTVTLPLLSGYIFCLDISPLNPDLLAIGTGDGKICVWNLSTDSYIDIATLSKKIDNKVMSVRWHPLYEGVLAFGTYEGRVGMFDLSQGRTLPTLFKLFHNKPIYKLCWAIPSTFDNAARGNEMHLFAVGNGDILQFNPSSPNEMPLSLNGELLADIEEACKCKHKSDLCYDSNQKLAAIGLSNGDVCICSAESFKLLHTIVEQPKAIMSLAWHPKIVYDCPTETSPCAKWLATAGENVLVYSIDSQDLNSSKKIASLEVHSSRVLCVSWSPHTNGRLLTCSADNTAIIWDVLSQTIIGRYSEHCAQVLCGVWSPVNKDVVITGSADFTCRIWSISKDTINKITDSKKKKDKIIEPTILNAANLNDSSTIDTPSVSFAKNSKTQTLLPSVNQDFPHGSLLDKIFTDAINKLKVSNANDSDSPKKCEENSATDDRISCNGIGNEIEDGVKVESNNPITNQKDESEEKNSNYNYAQVFGTDDELLKLVLHEERTLESSGNMSECLILNQAHYDLNNKIKEAINKNQVTEQLLALAPSVSPKLWKEACQVYIEQMIKADNIFQAVNYQLALAKDDEAIELLCEKNRFKEAFLLARLRTKEETVTSVLEKWIAYCYNCGLYRLGAHCHMYLKNEENACTLLHKSKLLKDVLLAIRLLKFHQPNRASDFAIECFKKHLSQLTPADAQILFEEFPEIKFLQPWYSAFKYFKEQPSNTADVTKWILGMLAESSLSIPTSDVNYDKLRVAIVDNTFNMNYEQLMTYVSALVALYTSGMSSEKNKASALRNYIRGLSHCYNYKIINGNKKNSDAAYPMMRILKLLFPKGLFQDFNSDLETDENTKMLCKSIKAYYCDFLFTWLVQCDDLPKSLKTLLGENEEIGDGDKDSETRACINSLEPYKDHFAVIQDKKTKLQKVIDLLTLYIDDVLDSRTVAYFRESFMLKKLENATSKTSSPKSRSSIEILECGRPSIGGAEPEKSKKCDDELEIEESNLSISGLSLDQSNTSEVFDDDVNNDKKFKSDLNGITKKDGKMNENDLTEKKMLKDLIEEFEKQRISAPNPFYFHCIAKEYLENSKEVDDHLSIKLRELITRSASKCGINLD